MTVGTTRHRGLRGLYGIVWNELDIYKLINGKKDDGFGGKSEFCQWVKSLSWADEDCGIPPQKIEWIGVGSQVSGLFSRVGRLGKQWRSDDENRKSIRSL
jgi:hypothetical protein